MKTQFIIWLLLLTCSIGHADPPRLHPENPRYFLWRNKPTILITSAEHYGAVLNSDFNYQTYLATLQADGLNYTRIFVGGTYVEPLGAFNIPRNTLAPQGDRFMSPFARSDQPGYTGGGNKFDLDRWDPQYFARLKGFLSEASRRGIVVEVTLFCPFYGDEQWNLSPLHPRNNINRTPEIDRLHVYTLDKHQGLLTIQERMTRKIVQALRDADNCFFEICNEPYFGGVTLAWQHRIVEVIVEAQQDHPHPKLIAQNIANGAAVIKKPHPAVSIFNYHYAAPPVAVDQNYHLNRVIGDDETGFRGIGDNPYRMEGWDFITAGGALYNNLDYSFVAGHENGSFQVPDGAPGGGNAGFRDSMRYLRDFIYRFDFIHMAPDNGVLKGPLPPGVTARALVNPGKDYAIYLRSSQLPGQFSARWTGTLTAPTSGEYTLMTRSNDGVRVRLDNRLVIDNWTEHSVTEDVATVTLKAGQARPLTVEFFYAGGDVTMQLLWSGPAIEKQLIPVTALHSPDNRPGLQADYFADMTLSARTRTVLESAVHIEAPDKKQSRYHFDDNEIQIHLDLPPGRYRAEWINTRTGSSERREKITHTHGVHILSAPAFNDDMALAVQAVK